jgi:uncharacterized protein (TIGR00369 family)
LTSDPDVAIPDLRVGGRRIVLEPHNCFACGTLNTHGLQLDLHAGGDRCWTELILGSRFEGWESIAHGGIICTILDEVMAWALVEHDLWAVTARMTVDFRRPVPVGHPIRGEGRVLEVRRRIVEAEGVILDAADRTLLARATGTYVGAPESRKRELKERYRFRLVPESDAASAAALMLELPDSVDVR